MAAGASTRSRGAASERRHDGTASGRVVSCYTCVSVWSAHRRPVGCAGSGRGARPRRPDRSLYMPSSLYMSRHRNQQAALFHSANHERTPSHHLWDDIVDRAGARQAHPEPEPVIRFHAPLMHGTSSSTAASTISTSDALHPRGVLLAPHAPAGEAARAVENRASSSAGRVRRRPCLLPVLQPRLLVARPRLRAA